MYLYHGAWNVKRWVQKYMRHVHMINTRHRKIGYSFQTFLWSHDSLCDLVKASSVKMRSDYSVPQVRVQSIATLDPWFRCLVSHKHLSIYYHATRIFVSIHSGAVRHFSDNACWSLERNASLLFCHDAMQSQTFQRRTSFSRSKHDDQSSCHNFGRLSWEICLNTWNKCLVHEMSRFLFNKK